MENGLSQAQKKLLAYLVEKGAEDFRSKALRDLGGVSLKDVNEVQKYIKNLVK